MNKSANPKKVCKQLFSEQEDSDQVKYKCKIISRLIFIKVLWESFHLNILIKVKLWTSFIIILLGFHHNFSAFCH